jgi:predicted GTPase
VPITDEDRRVAKMALKSRKPVILVVNKIDKNKKAKLGRLAAPWELKLLATSVPQKRGIDELLEKTRTVT